MALDVVINCQSYNQDGLYVKKKTVHVLCVRWILKLMSKKKWYTAKSNSDLHRLLNMIKDQKKKKNI